MVSNLSELNCNNAGLVLCHPFLIELYKALDYLDAHNCFKNPNYKMRAIAILSFMATGNDCDMKPIDLIVPKLLCGVPINHTLPNSIIVSSIEKEFAQELLEALIKHWKSLKQVNVDVLRRQFLCRPGLLKLGKTYELAIETNTIDILLESIPWNFNRITLPWSTNMIQVTWR